MTDVGSRLARVFVGHALNIVIGGSGEIYRSDMPRRDSVAGMKSTTSRDSSRDIINVD